jgi:type-F conjugative transfer system pilin assembly protein TrbC
MKYAFCVLIVLFSFFSVRAEVSYEDVNRLYKKAEEYANGSSFNDLERKVEERKKEGREFAERVYQIYQGSNFQKRMKEYKEILKNTLGLEGIEEKQEEGFSEKTFRKFYSDFYGLSGEYLVLDEDESLLIFVSSSMPEEVIRNYLADCSFVFGRVYFVLRGGINGLTRLKPTVSWVANLLKKNPLCDFLKEICEMYEVEFLIDPFLFKKYEIQAVPVVVYQKKNGIAVISPGAVSFKRHIKRIGEVLQDRRFLVFSSK